METAIEKRSFPARPAAKAAIPNVRRILGLDEITRARNIRKLVDFIDIHLEIFSRYNYPFAVISFTIDQFEDVAASGNDIERRKLLTGIVEKVSQRKRSTDLLARIDHGDFCLVSPFTSFNGAAILAEDLRQLVEHSVFIDRDITASFGLAHTDNLLANPDLISVAAGNMKLAQQHGNSVMLYGLDG